MNRVTIRTKKKSKGTMLSVFLEYNPAFVNPKGEEVRYEFLNLEKYGRNQCFPGTLLQPLTEAAAERTV